MPKILLSFLAVMLAASDQPADEASKKDVERMQGDWALTSLIREGERFPDDDAQALFRTIKGNEYTLYRFNKVIGRGTWVLDATKTPKTIDFQPVAPAGQTGGTLKPSLAIYEFEDEKLKICVALPGRDRPTEFISKPGSGLNVGVWEREKKPAR
jgi:uncharacterized protein (TIGR03067 family)